MNIAVDTLENVTFTKEDVHSDRDRVARRKYNLRKATKLGNLYKRKVIIRFRTLEGYLKKVEARVWSLGEEYVSLKGGMNIPVRSVEEVEF